MRAGGGRAWGAGPRARGRGAGGPGARPGAGAPALPRAVGVLRTAGRDRGVPGELSDGLVMLRTAVAALLPHRLTRDVGGLLLGVLLRPAAQRQLDVVDGWLAGRELAPALDLGVELLAEEDRDV